MKYKLGEICKIISGSTPKTEIPEYWDGSIKWITPAELSDDSYIITDSVRHITELGAKKTGLIPFPKGTVILSSRAPIGKVAIAGCEMYCNQGFKNLICSDIIDNRYLFWFLKGNTEYLNSLGRGATFKEISKQIVSEIEINLPDLDQQKKNVETLEKASRIIQLRRKELQTLDDLIKARFVEMFGDPVKNEMGWETAPLGDISDIRIGPFGSMLHKEDYITNGHALVNPSHIIDGQIRIDRDLSVTEEKYEELESYHLKPGDVILGRRGEMGRCAVVYLEGLLCGTGSMILRPNSKIIRPFFLQQVLSSPTYKKVIEDKAVGVTMKNLNVPIVSSLKIPLYPPEQQEAYFHLMYEADRTKTRIRQSINNLNTLMQSLMQEYFG